RTRYVLGWSNEPKIAALEEQALSLEARIAACGAKLSKLQGVQIALDRRLGTLQRLSVFESFRDLDWKPLAIEIDALDGEKRQLEQGSDVLRTLQAQLSDVEQAIVETKAELAKANEDKARLSEREEIARRQLDECRTLVAASNKDANARYSPRLESMLSESDRRLTVESCDARERDLRDRLQDRIDKEDHKTRRLQEKIVAGMTAYNGLYPSD